MDKEGEIMFEALSVCKNIKDFEAFLKKHKKPLGVEANFGVIDAEGGAAYFETNNTSFTKVDANDLKNAPEGYLIYTNYSYTGRFNEGMGYIRYQNARDIVTKKAIDKNITPEWIFNSLSRSYYHSLMGINLIEDEFSPEKGSGWVIDRAKAYIDAGADCIFTEALENEKEFEKFRKAVSVPLLANMTEFGKGRLFTYTELSNLGYNIVIYPVTTFRLAMGATVAGLNEIKAKGTQEGLLDKMQTRKDLYALTRYDEYNSFDQNIFNFTLK
jgi:hypothetical protein